MMEDLLISEKDLFLIKDNKIYFDNSVGYYKIYLGKNKFTYLHRYILNAKKGEIVDHINRNKKDNRRENLRFVSAKLNNYNKNVKNKLGRGIYYDKYGKRYRACISNENKTLKLGSFKTIFEAKKAYNLKAIEMYGKDAYQHEI